MLLSSLISLIYNDGVTIKLVLSGLSVVLLGLFAMLGTRKHRKEMNKREGYIVVTFGWIIMALSGAVPYLLTGVIPSFTSAFFETMSGYTTTGATILNDIEIVPKGVLFWRSTTHWIGGMGIIVLAIAILPYWALVACNYLRPKRQARVATNCTQGLPTQQNGCGSFILVIPLLKPYCLKLLECLFLTPSTIPCPHCQQVGFQQKMPVLPIGTINQL